MRRADVPVASGPDQALPRVRLALIMHIMVLYTHLGDSFAPLAHTVARLEHRTDHLDFKPRYYAAGAALDPHAVLVVRGGPFMWLYYAFCL